MLLLSVTLTFFPETFILMLIKSFAYQIMGVFGILVLFFVLKRQWRNVGLGAISFLLIFSILLPHMSFSGIEIKKSENGIRLGQFNVLRFNRDYQSTIEEAIKSGSDFINFQEVDARWATYLQEGLKEKYPYYKIVSQESCYGIAVFSKFPLSGLEVDFVQGIPMLKRIINSDKGILNFISVHTKAPTRYSFFQLRNEQINYVSRCLKKMEGPKVVIGDFNSVPWDDQIKGLVKDSNIRDSRKSLASTFPHNLPSIFKIPIDFIFHSEDLECLNFKVVNGHSSDHNGIVGDFEIKSLN